MRNSTLVFLIKRNSENIISEICLAMKKRGFGEGKWNGVGGKVIDGETIEEAAVREAKEVINVHIEGLQKVAELEFSFLQNLEWDQEVSVYFTECWEGIPSESEEMSPRWFKVSEIPFQEMWPDDIFWLPLCLEDKLVQASYVFAENDKIIENELSLVASW